MHYYCLHCQTQKCRQIAEMLSVITGVTIIQPKLTQRKWTRGHQEQVIHDYLPGYIFMYSEEPVTSFYEIKRIQGVFRILGTRENDYELAGSDLAFAQLLYDMDGTIGIMKTYEEGNIVKLDSSIYKGFNGTIRRIDRRKARAEVEFDFDGSTQRVWVGYDMISKQDC